MTSKTKKGVDSIYNTTEFKKLQLEWYSILDASGFDDIERSGRLSATTYHEYNAYLARNCSAVGSSYSSSTFNYYHALRKFSYDAKFASFFNNKDLKIPKNAHKSQSNPRAPALKLYRRICRLYGNGKTLQEISDHLKSHFTVPPTYKATRAGAPFSVFYVHTRLAVIKRKLSIYIELDKFQTPPTEGVI